MSNRDTAWLLSRRFSRDLLDSAFRTWLNKNGFAPEMRVFLVSDDVTVDAVVVLQQQEYVVLQEAPDSPFGWRVFPPKAHEGC
jgi:hypothetical protein